MALYNPATPNATDLISATQQPIKDNFFELNREFGIDHLPFNNGGANDGFHKQVTFNAPVAAAGAGTIGIAHTVNGGASSIAFNGIPVPFFSNSVGDFPIMPDLITAAPLVIVNGTVTQYSFKLGKMTVNMGNINITGTFANQTITYLNSFATATMYFSCTQLTPSNFLVPFTITNSDFKLSYASAVATTAYFIAIGY